jgi:hypothetical protein
MKKRTLHHFILFALVACLVPMLAYARKYPLSATPVVPGAKGFVDVGQDKNGNTEVHLKVEFLPKPSSLTPPAENYIVWFRQQGSEPEAQGQLKVDDNRRGEFKTTTHMKNFDVFVTAESEHVPKAPAGPEVLRATIQKE